MADLSRGRAGHLRIGAAPVQVEHLLSPACVELLRQAPKVTMQIMVGSNDVLLPALRRGELDVVLCGIPSAPYDDLVHERVRDDKFTVYASVNHPLARQKRVTIQDLAKERWALTPSGTIARRILQRMFEDEGLAPPTVVMETASLVPKIHLVASSNVLGFTPWCDVQEAAARFRLVKLDVPGLPGIRTVGVSYRKDAYQSPAARRFVEIVKARARETAKQD